MKSGKKEGGMLEDGGRTETLSRHTSQPIKGGPPEGKKAGHCKKKGTFKGPSPKRIQMRPKLVDWRGVLSLKPRQLRPHAKGKKKIQREGKVGSHNPLTRGQGNKSRPLMEKKWMSLPTKKGEEDRKYHVRNSQKG